MGKIALFLPVFARFVETAQKSNLTFVNIVTCNTGIPVLRLRHNEAQNSKPKEENTMTIREEINRQIKHIESQLINMQAFNPYKTADSINSMYWCGRQTASTTMDFIDTLKSLGLVTIEEYAEYSNRIGNLNNLLVKVHNELCK